MPRFGVPAARFNPYLEARESNGLGCKWLRRRLCSAASLVSPDRCDSRGWDMAGIAKLLPIVWRYLTFSLS